MEMLGQGYKTYLIWGLATVSLKFGLSIDWGVAAIIGMVITLVTRWLYDRSVAKVWQNTIDDNYTITKEYGYKTKEIFTDNATNTKNISVEKVLHVDKDNGFRNEVTITIYIKFRRVNIVYHTANYDDDMVSISGDPDANLTADFLMGIEKHAMCESSYVPKLR
jgi:hypothetical protein